MTDHNEAMRLADELDKWARDYATTDFTDAMATKAAALLRQQAERIAELEAERDKLTQGIAQGLDGQTLLTDLALREGGLYAGIEGGAAGLLAAGFAEQFVEAGGVNYVEVSFTHPKTGPLIVTLQRAQGKTPHKLRAEAEAERDQLRAEVERLSVERERWYTSFEHVSRILSGIHALMYPAPFTLSDGRTVVFRPKDPGPHEMLQALSDRIRAIPDEVAAIEQLRGK